MPSSYFLLLSFVAILLPPLYAVLMCFFFVVCFFYYSDDSIKKLEHLGASNDRRIVIAGSERQMGNCKEIKGLNH